MIECKHTICRYARSDELIREMLERKIEEHRLGALLVNVHRGIVPCRMPETAYPKNLVLGL